MGAKIFHLPPFWCMHRVNEKLHSSKQNSYTSIFYGWMVSNNFGLDQKSSFPFSNPPKLWGYQEKRSSILLRQKKKKPSLNSLAIKAAWSQCDPMNKGATDMPRDKVEILMESEYSTAAPPNNFIFGRKKQAKGSIHRCRWPIWQALTFSVPLQLELIRTLLYTSKMGSIFVV